MAKRILSPSEIEFAKNYYTKAGHAADYPYHKSKSILRKSVAVLTEIPKIIAAPYISKADTKILIAELIKISKYVEANQDAILGAKKAPELYERVRERDATKEAESVVNLEL